MLKYAILFNPTAGQGRSGRISSRIEARLKAYSIPYDLFITESEEHLRSLTGEKSDSHSALIGCGGDSTASIMIDEIKKRDIHRPLGMISTGSSNDIAREFGIETLDKACDALKKGRQREVDLGAVIHEEEIIRYYLGQANIGLGSYVAGYVEQLSRKKPSLGKRQILAGILAIRRAYKDRRHILPLTIRSDQTEIKGTFTIAVFNNIRYWATGKILDPASASDDGILNCCLVKPCSFIQLVRLSRLSQKQRLSESSETMLLRSKNFDVFSTVSFTIQVDGELIGGFNNPHMFRQATFRVMPAACTIIC